MSYHLPTENTRIAVACAHECDRQRVGLDRVAKLINAYDMARTDALQNAPDEKAIKDIALVIEPNANRFGYRKVPVTFNGIVGGVEPSAIPEAMQRFVEYILNSGEDPKHIVKQFLDIHPFFDGNGRTAFVLYNWLKGTWGNPLPLPDLYHND